MLGSAAWSFINYLPLLQPNSAGQTRLKSWMLGCADPTMPELQEMMGHAVNNLVKHFYKPEKEVGC